MENPHPQKDAAPAARNSQSRHHGKHLGALAMKIENELANLTQSERGVLAQDKERWIRMGAGAHLDDWLAYGAGLLLRRRMGMHMANTNAPEGKNYASAFAALLKADGLDSMDKQSISAVLWLHSEPERMAALRQIRDGMKVGERARLNSPISARQRVDNFLKAKAEGQEQAGGSSKEPNGTSPFAKLKEQNADLQRKIAELENKLAAVDQRDGSRFDLHHDTVDTIAEIITKCVSPGRAKNIASAITKQLKKAKTPAG
jgi:hypothetical protein